MSALEYMRYDVAFNPRFCAYAHANGLTPADMLGRFAPWQFMAFIRSELGHYCQQEGRTDRRLGDKADHAKFTEFLLARYPEPQA